jgi:hypothetical protein
MVRDLEADQFSTSLALDAWSKSGGRLTLCSGSELTVRCCFTGPNDDVLVSFFWDDRLWFTFLPDFVSACLLRDVH